MSEHDQVWYWTGMRSVLIFNYIWRCIYFMMVCDEEWGLPYIIWWYVVRNGDYQISCDVMWVRNGDYHISYDDTGVWMDSWFRMEHGVKSPSLSTHPPNIAAQNVITWVHRISGNTSVPTPQFDWMSWMSWMSWKNWFKTNVNCSHYSVDMRTHCCTIISCTRTKHLIELWNCEMPSYIIIWYAYVYIT